MPNVAEMEKLFLEILEKYEGRTKAGDIYLSRYGTMDAAALKTEIAMYKRRFEEAKNEGA